MGRRLGQHFLADYRTAQKIAAAASIGPDDLVLEIGGGRGALTEHLVGQGARLVVAELDEALADGLTERFGPAAQVESGDILQLDLDSLGTPRPWVVVGNLPYYLTSEIILWLCAHRRSIDRALIMVQAEVAERLAAEPGTEAWGRLSVLVQYHAEVELL
ncbi:MAG: hypothetical protein HUU35_01670, partial [Armatimonadetes bacterium]|nr:hypothetical protein [Armatimonadota bacterium]